MLNTRPTSPANDNAYAFHILVFCDTLILTRVVTCHAAHGVAAQHLVDAPVQLLPPYMGAGLVHVPVWIPPPHVALQLLHVQLPFTAIYHYIYHHIASCHDQ